MTTQTVCMPELDGGGEVIEFCAEVGQLVTEGDSLMVLESDKASIEVPSPANGTVSQWLVEIGTQIVSGAPLLELQPLGSGADASTCDQDTLLPLESKPAPEPETAPSPGDTTDSATAFPVATSAVVSAHINAGPAVRKLARELGIQLADVEAPGSGERLRKEHLKAHVKQRLSQRPAAPNEACGSVPPMPLEDYVRYGDIEHKDLTNIAKATVVHMTRCWLNIPHVTLFDEVNIDAVENFRKSVDPQSLGLPRHPTLLPFIIAVVARALRHFPQFNVALDEKNEQVIQKSYVNIGFAVDSPAGLLVPVIREADKKSIRELALEITALGEKARERKLSPADMQGGCFTVSSMGPMGGTGFTPIINGPEVAILGIAKASVKPVWDGERFVPVKQLPLCLSFDHRAINGGDAGRFMAFVNDALCDIRRLLL
ncbi:dihydrolipoamide acetyltransferase [Pseudomaricurvus alkylphenolicus]|uniref:2-oxo acid dehydrogenase subunit E2 n=1 Tax=Pseudomaricurvus alkylphenolicus TaxID=1306991 RepID=UPI00142094F7|nr:2-oxo acid dehydrogenase subunit E2 [Pseudomaricurvus alkylphenolicus]NIB43411.1 dihydrolipoamide acetyltransferase [Pseudomaricurvus alkylphenolicus]